MVARVGHVDVARAVGGNAPRVPETGRSAGGVGRAAHPRGSCQRGHHTGRGDLADSVVVRVGHVDVARAVGGNASRVPETGRSPGGVGRAAHPRGSSQRGHLPGGGDLADGVVARVGHVDVARAVGGNAPRVPETGRSAGGVGRAAHPRGSCQRGHHTGRGDLADGVVARVGQVDVARAVGGNVAWAVKTGGGACAIGVARPVHIARERGHGGC